MIDVGDWELFRWSVAASAMGLSCQQGHYPSNRVVGLWVRSVHWKWGRAEGEGEGEPVGAGEGREERGELIETRRRGRMGE